MDYLTYRWTNLVLLFYTTYISVDLAHHEIFHAKVGKGGISQYINKTNPVTIINMLISQPKTYVVGTQKNRLKETVLLSTQNI